MPLEFCIRRGQPEDASRLAVLATQVWLHTYATAGITADIAEFVLQNLTPSTYQKALNSPSSQCFVAEIGASLVGFALIKSNAPCPVENEASVELQTLYVQANFLGQGVGKMLLQTAQAEARSQSSSVLWLTVNAKNTRAIGFYACQGYTQVGTSYFVLGEERHENHVLIGANV